MKIVDVVVEYACGLTLSDRGTWIEALDRVYVSERLAAVVREFSASEAPPKSTASIEERTVELDPAIEGYYRVVRSGRSPAGYQTAIRRFTQPFLAPTRDQRQQFGRFLHTMSAASLAGAVGYWHSTATWDRIAVLNEAGLALAFVLTFYRGMVSMKGE